jgi:hypothetical protein
MRKKLEFLSEIIILLFAIGVWIFSFYQVTSWVISLKVKVWGVTPNIEYFWNYPLPPKPPLPPQPPCPPPPCVTPTPSPTPPPGEPTPTPTPTPTIPSGVTPTPTPTPMPVPAGAEGGVGGPPGAPVCGAQTPPAPNLKSLTAVGAGEVELFWDPVEPATHYKYFLRSNFW